MATITTIKDEYNKQVGIAINVIADTLGKIIPIYLGRHDPDKFRRWGGNCCKQSAMIIADIIGDLLGSEYFEPEVYEGHFEDLVLQASPKPIQYNHCWTYFRHKRDPKKSWFIDQGRTWHPRLCFQTDKHDGYPTDQPGYTAMTMFAEEVVDWKSEREKNEYYTQKTGTQIKEEVLYLLGEVLKKGR